MKALFESAGFEVKTIDKLFGGQYLWIESRISNKQKKPSKSRIINDSVTKSAVDYAKEESAFVTNMKNHLSKYDGLMAIWGAGAKGVSLANLVDPNCELVDCLVDLNPQKQGGYIPGSGHPIISYHDLPERGIKTALLMNPNYLDENLKLLKENNQSLELLNIESSF